MIKHQQKGAALIIGIIIIMSITLIIGLNLSFLAFSAMANMKNKIYSAQSLYASEAGLEDALLKLSDSSLSLTSPYSFSLDNQAVEVNVSELVGGARTITSLGNAEERIKKLAVTYMIKSDDVSFHYGVQIGKGGMIMGNNSLVEGNVFSNGSIVPAGGGNGEIDGTAIVAIDNNVLDSIDVTNGDAYTYSCKDSNISDTLYYVSGGTVDNCSYGSLVMLNEEIASEPLPISNNDIQEWKTEAEAGGTITGDHTYDSQNASLGPVKITGNLTITNNSIVNITGTIYVQKDLIIDNNAIAKLDSEYGSLSGMVIADGKISFRNNGIAAGSGEEGSFIMLLSTNASLNANSPAIDVTNNTEGAIFYTNTGLIHLHNNINIKEATGYQVQLDNNAEVNYETGLENISFTSGPGGSWEAVNWREIK